MNDARRIALEQLISRVAAGDRAAFDALYDTTSARIYAICLAMLPERPEAEAALCEVYLRIWRGAGRYASTGLGPMTWLVTMARNCALDRLRARPELPVAEDQLDAETPSHSEDPGLDLGSALRAVYHEGLSYADLAARLGVAEDVLRRSLRRGLLHFGQEIA